MDRDLSASRALPRLAARCRIGRRAAVAVAVAAILVVGTAVVASTVPALAAPTLLSQNKPATASSTEGAGTPAAAAVDGNTGTRWSSQFSDPQWLQVDLGATATVDQVVLVWEVAYARAFQIQVSTDGSTWTPIYSTTSGTSIRPPPAPVARRRSP